MIQQFELDSLFEEGAWGVLLNTRPDDNIYPIQFLPTKYIIIQSMKYIPVREYLWEAKYKGYKNAYEQLYFTGECFEWYGDSFRLRQGFRDSDFINLMMDGNLTKKDYAWIQDAFPEIHFPHVSSASLNIIASFGYHKSYDTLPSLLTDLEKIQGFIPTLQGLSSAHRWSFLKDQLL